MSIKHHIVMYSSGKASFVAAYLVVKKYGAENVTLLFADTKIEDESNYRFLKSGADYLEAELVVVSDGRTPWDVFDDTKWINHRSANCSKYLKQIPCKKWLKSQPHLTPENTILYVGIGFNEFDRMDKIRQGWSPFSVEAPLCWGDDWLDRSDIDKIIQSAGLTPSILYDQNFSHANCGGFCIRAGKAHFRNLLKVNRERYLYNENREQEFLKKIDNKSIGVLREMKQGVTRGLTLREFRERIEKEEEEETNNICDKSSEDWGGCGCFN